MSNLFVVVLRYIVDLEKVDTYREGHIRFLEANYTDGNFIVSGPQVPRSGGIIIAKSQNRSLLEEKLKDDPFFVHHLAEYQIYEFQPTRYIPELHTLLEMKIGSSNFLSFK